jgi:hypothetical protein
MAGQGQGNAAAAVAQGGQAPAGKELRLNAPTPFSGDRSKLKNFLQSCNLYLLVNADAYDSDDKKIAYALSNLIGGEAEIWKQQFIVKCEEDARVWNAANVGQPQCTIMLGTYTAFKDQLKLAFDEVDSVNDALHAIRNLRQGEKQAEDHNTQFKLLVGKAGIHNAGDTVLIDYYKNTLHPRLLQKIMSMETIPNDIDGWYARATTFDNNHRRMLSALGKRPSPSPNPTVSQPRQGFNFNNT